LEQRKFRKFLRIASELLTSKTELLYGVVDLHIGPDVSKNSPPLEVACPRRELERNFEIVLFAEDARVELKSSANES
jgi:hypothetical protein